jgi:hypothetical protein
MNTRYTLTLTMLASLLAALIAPALAEAPARSQAMPDQGMGMGRTGHGMMSHGMMSGGCAGMMQSMNGNGPPNSQWRQRPHDDSMPN